MNAESIWTALRRLGDALVRAFHSYGGWLVGISWWRFMLLALLLLIATAFAQNVPPFSWSVRQEVRVVAPRPPLPAPPVLPVPPRVAITPSQVEVTVEPPEVWIRAGEAASAASEPQSGPRVGVRIQLPPEVSEADVQEAVRDVQGAMQDVAQAHRDVRQAREDIRQARDDVRDALRDTVIVERETLGDVLMQFALLWIVASAILKITYKGQLRAQVQAAQATETAEAEALRRQVVEARMAAMQAQVEPHFLFNTLASIDHLIETDPPRASQMQKHLIALLRASMPSMREAADTPRPLARELELVRPYVEILKVRMDERLDAQIDVPDGLLSAEFPALMLQTLVENAIRHGLEPKAEGGSLRVTAQIVHGKLEVVVADTGVGFGAAATLGSSVGLANVRERLQLRYGSEARLAITANAPGGTVATLTLPYRSLGEA